MSDVSLGVNQGQAGNQTHVCEHCGTRFQSSKEDERFCCHGCEYVYRLIHEKDLDRYYSLKDRVTTPVGTTVFNHEDWKWLEARIGEAEVEAQSHGRTVAEVSLSVQGVSCMACVWLIQKIFEDCPGAVDIQLDVRYGQLLLQWRVGEFDIVSLANELKSLGYVICQTRKRSEKSESRQLSVKLGLCAAFAMNTMLATLPHYLGMEEDFILADLLVLLALMFATLSMLVGGMYFIKRAWSGLRYGSVHMDVPIALGLCAAYVGSLGGWLIGRSDLVYFDFVSVFVLLMLLGRWIQAAVLEHNRARYLEEYDMPETVKRVDREELVDEPLESIAYGHVLEIPSNGLVPVAGRLKEGVAVLNMQCINGEQETRELKAGELLPSGAIHCGKEPIRYHAEESWQDSLMARLVARSESSYENKLLGTILRNYMIVVMFVALVGGIYWAMHSGVVDAAQVVISVLVVSCPCAIGVALPLLDEMMVVAARTRGIYIRSEHIWSRLRSVKRLVFDKTGTLTLEKPALENPERLESLSEHDRKVLTALVRKSLHPLARSLNQVLSARFASSAVVDSALIEEAPGSGMRVGFEGSLWTLGKPGWQSPEDAPGELVFARDGEVLAGFYFVERARERSQVDVKKFQQAGYRICILSGDREGKVEALAQALGIDEAHARQSPDDKARWVREHKSEGVLMVGDGLNDSLALNESSCSGVVVTDLNVLGHKADFLLMGSALRGVSTLVDAARVRDRGVKILFSFNVIYNFTVVSLALMGMMNPLIAAIVMPLSSVVSTLIALAQARRLA